MRFSIIMPVLNEEAEMENQLAHLTRQCVHNDYELLIVDGGSSDGTVAIAQRYGQFICSRRGLPTQRNAGPAIASGDFLIFLHADTRLPDDAFCAIERAFASPNVVGGAFRLCFNCECWPYQLVAFTTNLRSRLRTLFTGDQAYFIRTSSFTAVDGYPDQPLMEYLEIITRLQKIGKVVLMPQYVSTSARRHNNIGLLRSVLFMWYLRTLYKLGVSAVQLQRIYLDVR